MDGSKRIHCSYRTLLSNTVCMFLSGFCCQFLSLQRLLRPFARSYAHPLLAYSKLNVELYLLSCESLEFACKCLYCVLFHLCSHPKHVFGFSCIFVATLSGRCSEFPWTLPLHHFQCHTRSTRFTQDLYMVIILLNFQLVWHTVVECATYIVLAAPVAANQHSSVRRKRQMLHTYHIQSLHFKPAQQNWLAHTEKYRLFLLSLHFCRYVLILWPSEYADMSSCTPY